MTLSTRGHRPPPPNTPLEYLSRIRHDAHGRPFLSNEVYKRAKDLLEVLPTSMPLPIIRALADGTVMVYWNRTNIPGFDYYDSLELHIEVTPSCRITYNWTISPGTGYGSSAKDSGSGVLRAEYHVIRLLDTSARYALEVFAPHAIIPQRGLEVKDEQG